jgi:hypothetical protein
VSPAATLAATEHRIGVRQVDGAGEFFDRATGARFTPRGNNLVRLDRYHNLFNPGAYDAADMDAQLGAMAALGYNVVRVFLDHRQGGLADQTGNGLNPAYLDNIADFLAKGRAHGVYVILCQDWLPDASPRYAVPDQPDIAGVNSGYLTSAGVAANSAFFADFVDGLIARHAALDAVWAFELRNELFFEGNQPPFNRSAGQVTTANGRTYDLGDANQKRALLEDGLVFWADQVRAEILRHDPTALVAVGFFVPQGPNPTRVGDNRIIETREVIESSTLDFVDLHGYPGADLPLPQHLENFGMTGSTAKPIVMGEMGAFHSAFPSIDQGLQALISWQSDSCAFGFDGWLLWSWDDFGSGTGVWAGTEEGGVLANGLAPANRPDPCSSAGGVPVNLALNGTTRTSSALADAAGALAVDGQAGTIWNAGDYAPQWIEVELSASVASGMVWLVVAQSPDGMTRHRLYGRLAAGGALIPIGTWSGHTSSGQVLTFTLNVDQPIRYLRVETVKSPSWVAWAEIEVSPDQ